jgi:hypothetical protein
MLKAPESADVATLPLAPKNPLPYRQQLLRALRSRPRVSPAMATGLATPYTTFEQRSPQSAGVRSTPGFAWQHVGCGGKAAQSPHSADAGPRIVQR